MLAWATRWPCALANSVPMRVRSKPTALPYGRSISRFDPVPQPQSRMRGAPRRRSRARARASCTGGTLETRSAIVRRGRSVRVAGPQKDRVLFYRHTCASADPSRPRPSCSAPLVLACVFTYPYILHFNDAGRLDTNDGRWSIWVVSWVAHALTTDPLHLFRANIFYPHTNALAFSEGNIVEGVIGAPVWAADEEPVHHAQLRLPVCVRAVVRRDVLPGAAPHRRSPRRRCSRASCSPTARSRSRGRRTSSC